MEILAVRGALPANRHTQAEITDAFSNVIARGSLYGQLLRRLHANAGFKHRSLVLPLAAYGEKVRKQEAERDYPEIVQRVRSGPPLLSPMRLAPVERLVDRLLVLAVRRVQHEVAHVLFEGERARMADSDALEDWPVLLAQ